MFGTLCLSLSPVLRMMDLDISVEGCMRSQVSGLFGSVVVKTVCIVSRYLKYTSGLMSSELQVVSW